MTTTIAAATKPIYFLVATRCSLSGDASRLVYPVSRAVHEPSASRRILVVMDIKNSLVLIFDDCKQSRIKVYQPKVYKKITCILSID